MASPMPGATLMPPSAPAASALKAALVARLQSVLPVAVVLAGVLLLWYALAIALNAPGAIERHLGGSQATWSGEDLIRTTWSMDRPVLPAPHQIARDTWHSLVDWPIDNPRSLVFHG